ncbi:hypothetical protein RSOL_001230, partial [Rhizoctonia solani AG-3 Rhs1AP]
MDDHHHLTTSPPLTPRKRARRNAEELSSAPASIISPPTDLSYRVGKTRHTLVTLLNNFTEDMNEDTSLSHAQVVNGYSCIRLTLTDMLRFVDSTCKSFTDSDPSLLDQSPTLEKQTQTDDLQLITPGSEDPLPTLLPGPTEEHLPTTPVRTYASVATSHQPRQAHSRPPLPSHKGKSMAAKSLNPVRLIVQLKHEPSLPIRDLPAPTLFRQLMETCATVPNAPIPLGVHWNQKGNLIVAFPAGTSRTAIKKLHPNICLLTGAKDTPTLRFDVPWRRIHLASIRARDHPDQPVASNEELRLTLQLNPAIKP